MASPPLYVTLPPKEDVLRGDGTKVSEFFEARCRVTKESLGGRSGTLIRVRPWQRNLFALTYARRFDGRLRHRRGALRQGRAKRRTDAWRLLG